MKPLRKRGKLNIDIDKAMEDILVPIFICVFLPVLIVWLVMRTKQNETNKRAEVVLKAIEAGVPVDMAQLESGKKKSVQSVKQELLEKLNGACITSLMGTAFVILGILRSANLGIGIELWGFGTFLLPTGCILLAVGIGLFITYFVGKKMLAKEIEAEEKKLEQ